MTKPGCFHFGFVLLCVNGKTNPVLKRSGFITNPEQFASLKVPARRGRLRLSGKGGRPNKALGLTNDELEKFWSEKQLGDHSPEAVLRTVWLNNTMHFGWRARDEHRKVLLGGLEI